MALSLIHAHAIAMILAWMVFAPTGVLFAVYGRSIRLGTRRQFLGKAMWFQIHRFLFSLNPMFTLTGFLLILVEAEGGWVDPHVDDLRLFLHSVGGGIIVCAVLVQIWLALYRCPPQSRFRVIFNWSHRLMGFIVYYLSTPTIFLVLVSLSENRVLLLTIMSCWTAENLLTMLICAKLHRQPRVATNVLPGTSAVDVEGGANTAGENQRLAQMKLLLFLLNFLLNCALSIALIVLISRTQIE